MPGQALYQLSHIPSNPIVFYTRKKPSELSLFLKQQKSHTFESYLLIFVCVCVVLSIDSRTLGKHTTAELLISPAICLN